MTAADFFVYTASFASIVILILVCIGFYLFYKTLNRVQSFLMTAETMLNEVQLAKIGTALSAYKTLRSVLSFFTKGVSNYAQ